MVNRFVAVANIGAAAMAAFILHGCGKEKEEVPEPTEEDIDKKNGDDVAVEHGKKKGHTRAEDDKKKGTGKDKKRGVDLEDDENRPQPADCSEQGNQEEQNAFCKTKDATYWCNNGECMPQHVKHKMTHEEVVKAGQERLAEGQGKENWKEENQDTQELQKEKAEGNSQLAFKGGDEYKKNTAGVTGQITAVTPSGGKKKS